MSGFFRSRTRPDRRAAAPAQSIPPAEPGPAERSAAEPALPEPEIIPPCGGRTDPGRAGPGEPPRRADPGRAGALAEPGSAGTAGPAPLPIANYDDLSLASLRARLRNLDSAQLHALLGYEQAHAARPAVLGMFERRISKLETGQG